MFQKLAAVILGLIAGLVLLLNFPVGGLQVGGQASPIGNYPDFPLELRRPAGVVDVVMAVSPHLRKSVSYSGGGSIVSIQRHEADPQGVWHSSLGQFSVAFDLTAVAAGQCGNVLYVAGILSDGKDVIERWQFPLRQGGYAQVPTSGPRESVGVSMAPFAASEQLQGAVFVPPGPRIEEVPVRRVVYIGSDIGHVQSMAVDPEDRELVLHSFAHKDLWSIDLTVAPPTPTVMVHVSDLDLLGTVDTLEILHHDVLGRCLWMTQSDVLGSHVLLRDVDNDAVFETVDVFTEDEWEAAGINDYRVFHRYQSFGVDPLAGDG